MALQNFKKMVKNITLLQIKALIWKIYVIRKHEYKSTIVNILLPSVLVIIMAYTNAEVQKNTNNRFDNKYNVNTKVTPQEINNVNSSMLEGFTNNTNSSILALKASNQKSTSNILQGLYAEFIIYGFAFVLPSILERIIEEKKSGIKELLKLMGLKQWTIWFGYFMDSFVLGFISTVLNVYYFKTSIQKNANSLLPNCNSFLLFWFLILYLISFISFAFALSTFFYNATCASIISFFVCIFSLTLPRNALKKNKDLSYRRKLIFSLLPNAALYLGFEQINFYETEDTGMTWSNASISLEGELSMRTVFVMFFIDTILYVLVSMYIENVMPGPYGVAKPFNFPYKYFRNKVSNDVNSSNEELIVPNYVKIDSPPNLPIGIQVINLTKQFRSLIAVNNFSINIYQGEITVLLGHNGAGKTTLMSIITGMISPSSGSVFINSKNIKYRMDEIRQSLGVCMQNDLHFSKLTVIEHLIFFGMIKGLSNKEARAKANNFVEKVHIAHRQNCVSSKLSGGMKRKLSLGIALIGDPKLLILDEPSSGLDPESRREIWDTLLACRRSRTILVTTHFMEEADVLGDRIAIMHFGQLVCFGSSFYLKKEFGSGYHLLLICNNINVYTGDITDVIKKTIPTATLQNTSGNSLTYLLPHDTKSLFGKLFKEIEKNKSSLNITSISLSITTLEEVFLRVDQLVSRIEKPVLAEAIRIEDLLLDNMQTNCYYELGKVKKIIFNFISLFKKRLKVGIRDWAFYFGQLLTVVMVTLLCLHVGNPLIKSPELYDKVAGEQIWDSIFPICILLVTGSFLFFPQSERASNAKQLQLMCGVHDVEYWLVCVLWDVFFFLVASLCIFLTIYCYGLFKLNIFQEDLEKKTLFIILITYMCSMIPFSYLFSYSKTGTRGFTMLLMCSIFVGSIMRLVIILMSLFIKSKEKFDHWNTVVDFLFPQICFSTILSKFIKKILIRWKSKYSNVPNSKSLSYISDKEISFKLLLLLKSALFYTMILTLWNHHFLHLWREKCVVLCHKYVLRLCKKPPVAASVKDENVLNEEERIFKTFELEKLHPKEVLNSYLSKTNTDLILVSGIHKMYKGKYVVNGVSFAIKPGDCFGLLGVNGAGKTTTFRMLTGDIPIATGGVRIYTTNKFLYISKHSRQFLKCIGYCPQIDAIIPSLTGREMLYFIAELRGLYRNRNTEVEIWISALGLEKCADRRCGTYSGGNKRKLGMGIALIGNPSVVFFDEPSSGVDPVSRRKMWDTINIIQKREVKPSIILTSHSMEECEALCNTLAIMKAGQLACYGEIPILKSIYALGFVVLLKLKTILEVDETNQPTTSKDVKVETKDSKELKKLMRTFENFYKDNCVLTDKHEGLLRYRITDKNKTWSLIFLEIEQIQGEHKIIEDYSISETSLEEIFLTIARSK